jgi:hypothetical protein
MKNYLFRWTACITLLIPCSISCSKIHPPSNFLNSFSLGETIKRMNVEGIDLSSAAMSSSASAGDPSPHRRDFNLQMTIKDSMADSFDERAFLAKLQEKITQEAQDSGVQVAGGGSSNDSFDINYHNGKHEGGIDVIGVRTEKNQYKVWCIIRELASNSTGYN